MANVHIPAGNFETPLSANAPVKTPVAWSNGVVVQELQFTGTTQTATYVFDTSQFTTAIVAKIKWKANATTGTAQLEAAILAHATTAGASVESHAFATASNATTTTSATANDINETTITIANQDSITNAKFGVLRIGKIGGTIAVSVNVLEVNLNIT